MKEIDYQLSLMILQILSENGLVTTKETEEITQRLRETYQPEITNLSLLKDNSERK